MKSSLICSETIDKGESPNNELSLADGMTDAWTNFKLCD